MTIVFDADLAVTELGVQRPGRTTVGEAHDAAVAEQFAEFTQAREAGDGARQAEILDHAYALDPGLVDELLGFDYPAVA